MSDDTNPTGVGWLRRMVATYGDATEGHFPIDIATARAVLDDANRWATFRRVVTTALTGGCDVSIDWDDDRAYHKEPNPARRARIYWYPTTPIGFYSVEAPTLDAAMDQLLDAGA